MALRSELQNGSRIIALPGTEPTTRGYAAGVGWERTQITAEDCPRISPEFLADERQMLGEHAYRQEYPCEFLDANTAAFGSEMV